MKTTVCRMHTYELGHVKDLKADTYNDEPHIQKPPKCYSTGETVMVESDPQNLKAWAELRGEPKMFTHAVMHAIDILAENFSTLDLKDVKRKCNKAFNMGWKEPEFTPSRQRGRYRIQTALSTAKLLWNLNLLVTLKINCMQNLQNNTGRRWRSQAF